MRPRGFSLCGRAVRTGEPRSEAFGYRFYGVADGGPYPPMTAVGGLAAAAGSSGRTSSSGLAPVVEATRPVLVEA